MQQPWEKNTSKCSRKAENLLKRVEVGQSDVRTQLQPLRQEQAAEYFHVRRIANGVGSIAPNYNVALGGRFCNGCRQLAKLLKLS
jgi:hypothetical protein